MLLKNEEVIYLCFVDEISSVEIVFFYKLSFCKTFKFFKIFCQMLIVCKSFFCAIKLHYIHFSQL